MACYRDSFPILIRVVLLSPPPSLSLLTVDNSIQTWPWHYVPSKRAIKMNWVSEICSCHMLNASQAMNNTGQENASETRLLHVKRTWSDSAYSLLHVKWTWSDSAYSLLHLKRSRTDSAYKEEWPVLAHTCSFSNFSQDWGGVRSIAGRV
jgi:hypothetical protein